MGSRREGQKESKVTSTITTCAQTSFCELRFKSTDAVDSRHVLTALKGCTQRQV